MYYYRDSLFRTKTYGGSVTSVSILPVAFRRRDRGASTIFPTSLSNFRQRFRRFFDDVNAVQVSFCRAGHYVSFLGEDVRLGVLRGGLQGLCAPMGVYQGFVYKDERQRLQFVLYVGQGAVFRCDFQFGGKQVFGRRGIHGFSQYSDSSIVGVRPLA